MTEQKSQHAKTRAVEIRAEVRQVKTMADHSINVTLNLPEDCVEQAKVLLGWQGDEVIAVIENVTNDDDDRGKHKKIHI